LELYGKNLILFKDKKKSEFDSILFQKNQQSTVFLEDCEITSNYILEYNITLHCRYGDDLDAAINMYKSHFGLSYSIIYDVTIKSLTKIFNGPATYDVLLSNDSTNEKIKIGNLTCQFKDINEKNDLFSKAIVDSFCDEIQTSFEFTGNVPEDWLSKAHKNILSVFYEFEEIKITGNIGKNAFQNLPLYFKKLTICGNVESHAFGTEFSTNIQEMDTPLSIFSNEIIIEGILYSNAFYNCNFKNLDVLKFTCAAEDSFNSCCGTIRNMIAENLYSNCINITIRNLTFTNISDKISVKAMNYNVPNSQSLQYIHKNPRDLIYALSKIIRNGYEDSVINTITIRNEIETFNSIPILKVPAHMYDNWHCIDFSTVKNVKEGCRIEFHKNDGTFDHKFTLQHIIFNEFYEEIPEINILNFIWECQKLYSKEIYFSSFDKEEQVVGCPSIGLNYVYCKINNEEYYIGKILVKKTTWTDCLAAITPTEYLESIFITIVLFYSCSIGIFLYSH
jgi:hypothetical protein